MILCGETTIGLDFHDYSAQVVAVSTDGKRMKLEAYNRILIPPNIIVGGEIRKPKELRVLISELFKNANPHPIKAEEVVLMLPSVKIFPHVFDVPAKLSKSEIEEFLPNEAESIIPYPIKEMYWDYGLMSDKKRALFVGTPKKVAEEYVEFLESMGLKTKLLGADIETLQFGLRGQIFEHKDCLIIDVEALGTNFLVIKDGMLQDVHSSAKGGKCLISGICSKFQEKDQSVIMDKDSGKINEKYLPEVEEVIKGSYRFGQKLINENNIKTILITGEFADFAISSKKAEEYFPGINVQIGDPKKSLEIKDKKFKGVSKGEEARYYSTFFTNAAGIAIRWLEEGMKQGINLLPTPLKESIAKTKQNVPLTIISLVMTVSMLLVATFTFYNYQALSHQKKLMEIEKESMELVMYGGRYQEVKEAVELFNNEIEKIREIERGMVSVPHTLRDIRNLFTQDVTINSINFNHSNLTATVRGVAKDRDALLNTVRDLNESKLVEGVDQPLASFDRRTDIPFNLTLRLIQEELTPYGTDKSI